MIGGEEEWREEGREGEECSGQKDVNQIDQIIQKIIEGDKLYLREQVQCEMLPAYRGKAR